MSQYNNSYDVSRVNIAASQHTPGPWRVGDAGHTIFGPKESDGRLPQRIGEVCAVREDYLANASLIAAAPELLAALRGIQKAAERHRNRIADDHEARWIEDTARAAIAKAVQS